MRNTEEDIELLKELCKDYGVSFDKVVELLNIVKDYELLNRRIGVYEALKVIISKNKVD
jgi:uncharacterized protein YjgD (DUF1641 family)